MIDARFYRRAGVFRLTELAEAVGARLVGDGESCITDVAPLHEALQDQLGFFENKKYREAFLASKAGAVVTSPAMEKDRPEGMALLLHPAPYAAFAMIAARFYPDAAASPLPTVAAGVAGSARIGAGVKLAPGAVIGENAEIGDGSMVGHGAVIGDGVVLGRDCRIGDQCVVTHSILGDRVVLFAGVRLGQDGFGYAPSPQGLVKVPQLGRVLVGDDVHIGANSTVDRGSLNDTILGNGCKIDNLVQIGHNVELGAFTIVVAQVGIAGSTKIGAGSMIGGQAGIAGHLTIGKGVQIAAQSGITHDLPDGAVVGGTPAVPIRQWHRQSHALAKLVGGKV